MELWAEEGREFLVGKTELKVRTGTKHIPETLSSLAGPEHRVAIGEEGGEELGLMLRLVDVQPDTILFLPVACEMPGEDTLRVMTQRFSGSPGEVRLGVETGF